MMVFLSKRTLTALLAFTVAGCALIPRDRPTAKVMVFNIHAGKDAGGQPNLDGVADLVRTTGADLVLLQEVDRGTRRSGNVDQPETLAESTGLSIAFGRSLDYDGGEYGIATLSRDGIRTQLTESLPVVPSQERSGGSHEPRVALTVTTTSTLGRVQVVNTHLDASAEETYRLQEVHNLGLLARRLIYRAVPLVVGGDFNAEPGSESYKRLLAGGLRDAWTECGTGDGLTYPADKPVKRIDYLFLTDGLVCTGAEVIDSRVSDHRPLLVTIALAEQGGSSPAPAPAGAAR